MKEFIFFDFLKNFPQQCIVRHHITVVVQLTLDYDKVAKHDLSSQSSWEPDPLIAPGCWRKRGEAQGHERMPRRILFAYPTRRRTDPSA